MLRLVPMLAAIALICGLSFAPPLATAQDDQAVQVTSGAQYQFLGRWDADRLNQILNVDTPKFAGISVTYSPARNAVRLFGSSVR